MKKGFKKSSFCANDSCCVEVKIARNKVTLRDMRGRTVNYTRKEWLAFLAGAKAGQFDVKK